MATVLIALLAVSDAPVVAGTLEPEWARERQPVPGEAPLLAWGMSLSSLGVTSLALGAWLFAAFIISTEACVRTNGCIADGGIFFLIPAALAVFGFVNASVGFPLIGQAIHLRRLVDER